MAAAVTASSCDAPPPSEVAGRAGSAVMVSRMLSSFVREVGGVVLASRAAAPEAFALLESHGCPVQIELSGCRRRLLAALARCSPGGHHEFAGPVRIEDETGVSRSLDGPAEVAAILLEELEVREGAGAQQEQRRQALQAQIRCSIDNTRAFTEAACAQSPWTRRRGISRFIAAEQSLVFGHPFHPAPKSSDFALGAAASRYRPELGASFRLDYFAVDPELLLEDALAGVSIDAAVLHDIGKDPPLAVRGWPLLPAHPWQVELLRQLPEIEALMRSGRLIPLGSGGEIVFPTSSVRTVYAPERDVFIKLPLDARITNFVRNNPIEHLERSMTASRVLERIARTQALDPLSILPELGYRGIHTRAWTHGADRTASFAVLFRRGLRLGNATPPVVVAALLEPALPGGEAPIAAVLWSAARAAQKPLTAALVGQWVARYVSTVLVPLISLFVRHGVSLEAHVQNALIVLDDGWPERLVVRDLEGTSMSRTRGSRGGAFADIAPEKSGIWVDDAEAWRRTLYYVLVNHFAHVLASLAAHGPAEEWQLWQVARSVLEDAPELGGAENRRDVQELLRASELPAKANWLSCFRGAAEHPAYVSIPNPFAADEALP